MAAYLLRALGLRFAGDGEAIYEGTVGLAAAGLLTGMIFWMRRHASKQSDAAGTNLRLAVSSGRGAVFALAFVAVVREGIELALFLNAAALRSAASAVTIGAVLGLLVAAAAGWVLFATALRFSLSRFFQISGALLLVMAAGFVSHAVGEFIEVGWIPPLIEPIWNTTGWLPETSVGGAMLKALFGYRGAPAFTEVAAYALFLMAVGWALRHSRATGNGSELIARNRGEPRIPYKVKPLRS